MRILITILISLGFIINIKAQADFGRQPIISWIQENCFPIQKIKTSSFTKDLEPFKQILKDVRVIGMGELTHGTSECYLFEHRLFEFLVKELDFDAIVIEASTAACQRINEYILYGKGDLEKAFGHEIYSLWDTKEMWALIEWMRSYNIKMKEGKKLQFFGMDLLFNEIGRKKVRGYIKVHIPDWLAPVDSLFEVMAAADPKTPMRMNEFKETAALLIPRQQELFQHLNAQKEALIAKSSKEEYEQILRYIRIMEQFLMFHETYALRSGFMGENMLDLTEKMPDSKFMVLAHQGHVAVYPEYNSVGTLLKKQLGDAYYAFCYDTHQGSFLAQSWNGEQLYLEGFKTIEFPLVEEETVATFCKAAQKGDFFLNLRVRNQNPSVKKWLETPQKLHGAGWIPNNIAGNNFLKEKRLDYFDGLLFIEKTSPSHPSKQALKLIPKREGL